MKRILYQFFLKNGDKAIIEMYSAHNEGKSVIAERFIRTLKKQNLQIYDVDIKKWV